MVGGPAARVCPVELAEWGMRDELSMKSLVGVVASFAGEVACCGEGDGEDEDGAELLTVGALSLHPTSTSIEHK